MQRLRHVRRILALIAAAAAFFACPNPGQEPVAVTGIALNKHATTVLRGGSERLYAVVSPIDAANPNVAWSTDAPTVVSVSSAGLVSGLVAGTAVITVTTEDGGFTDTCTVTVSEDEVPVTGVSLDESSLRLVLGSAHTLHATVRPSGATNQNVAWGTDFPTIAAVSPAGNVTAVGIGTATITVRTDDGGFTDACTVTVVGPAVTGVAVSPVSASVQKGATRQLTATVTPSNADNKTVEWSSGNDLVATVSTTGLVTGVNLGTATITATTDDGHFTDTCVVTVVPVAVTGVGLDKQTLSLALDGTGTLTATVIPANAANQAVTWSTSASSVATVSSTGVVTAGDAGTAIITVTTDDGGFTDTCTVTVGGVYVSGVVTKGSKEYACYWRIGVRTDFPEEGGQGVGILVQQGSISVSGYYGTTGNLQACYWKDAVRHDLDEPAGTVQSIAYRIYANGSSIYITGAVNNGTRWQPGYWKDGAWIGLSSLGDGYTQGIAVVGSDIHVSGYYEQIVEEVKQKTACHWVNSGQAEPLDDDDLGSWAGDLTVDNGSIYIAGAWNVNAGSSSACYWKDGARVPLSYDPYDTETWGVCVSDGVVYAAGEYDSNTAPSQSLWRPCLWEDDQGAPLELPTGTEPHGEVYGIDVAEGVVSIAGWTSATNPGVAVPCLWTDGVRTDLSSGDGDGYVYAVAAY